MIGTIFSLNNIDNRVLLEQMISIIAISDGTRVIVYFDNKYGICTFYGTYFNFFNSVKICNRCVDGRTNETLMYNSK